jgi:hypothetical protein
MDFKSFFSKFKRKNLGKHKSNEKSQGFKPGTKFGIKHAEQNYKTRDNKTKKKRAFVLPDKFYMYIFYIVVICAFVAIIFFSSKAVINIRNTDDVSENIVFIKGLDQVPQLPDSESVFMNVENNELVQKFLDKGYLVYRLPTDKTINDTFDYYKETLPQYGWHFEGLISVADTDKKFGQYWSKDSIGLRIYSDINDIWYQKLSIAESKNFLSDQVKKEKEIDLILSQKDLVKLLPNYPWRMTVPAEYLVSYSKSSFEDKEIAIFSKISATEVIKLEPIAYNSGDVLNTQFTEYCTKNEYSIVSTEITESKFGMILKFEITKGGKNYFGYILNHPETQVLYLIYGSSTTSKSSLYQYLLDNLEAVDQTKLS